MEANDIESFVASLTTEQKDQLWEIVQNRNETAIFVATELAEELENSRPPVSWRLRWIIAHDSQSLSNTKLRVM